MISKKSYAKVNIFLKIAGRKDNYHLLVSRFVRVKSLFDTISFVSSETNLDEFILDGNFGCETKQNTIYKAYLSLCEISSDVEKYFKTHKVVVEKTIPEFAGLGGGSSNCATFILMVNDVCNLNLSKDKLAQIGATIGADVPFFIYEYDSANVTGIGEVVERFDEDILNIEVFTPQIKCDTGAIFRSFREKFYKEICEDEANKLLAMRSIDILKSYSKEYLNDLYLPALDCDIRLKDIKFPFFSGSGSSFFMLNSK